MWTRLGTAVLTALVVIFIAELSARAVVSRIDFAHSYDEPRNPNFRRAWPAFTEPRPREPQDKLVILISNSQGFATELEDGNLCYAHLIQEQLNQQDPSHKYTVANWSIGGASGPEMLLLAARAVEHKPDLLMLVTHSNPFTQDRVEPPLSFYLSDANQLAYYQSVRPKLPKWFLLKNWAYDPTTFLEVNSGLVRWQCVFVEQRYRRWQVKDNSTRSARSSRRLFSGPPVRQSGDRMLQALVDTFRRGQPDAPVLIVSMPLCEPKWTPGTWPRLHNYGKHMRELLQDRPGVTVVDAIDAIDHKLFLTHAHLNEQGHADFSRYLLPHIADMLDLSLGPVPARE